MWSIEEHLGVFQSPAATVDLHNPSVEHPVHLGEKAWQRKLENPESTSHFNSGVRCLFEKTGEYFGRKCAPQRFGLIRLT